MGLLFELLRLMRCRELSLFGQAQELVGFLEVPRCDLRLRAADEIARDRVLRIEVRRPAP